MTTAACITLGLIAFWPQTPQQRTATVTKNPILSPRTYQSHGTDGAVQHFATLPANKPSFVISKLNVATLATAKIPLTPIATADSLQPVELSPDQLAKLGIVLEDNGDIDFYTKSNSTGEVNKFGLPPSWGVRLHLGEKFSKADIARITIPKSPPRLVTQPDGAKRLFSFESDTSFTNLDGGRKTKVQMHNSLSISPNTLDSSPRVFLNKTITETIGDNDPTTNAKFIPDPSDSLLQNENVKVIVKIFDDSSVSKDTKFDLSLDSILEGKPGSTKSHENRLIISDNGSDAMSSLTSASNALHRADSVLSQSELNGKYDTAAKMNLRTAEAEYEMAVKALRKTAKAFSKNNIQTADSADRADFWIREAAVANSVKLDHLIPIRVVNLKNAAHPNELIFWYEPTPELTSTLPASVNSNPAPQSKQLVISVYPNPTIGPATVHYQLSDAPKAYFSVRNLLGQEVLNGGATSGTVGDMNLDLSQLPAGVYLLVTTTDNGERDVERVVVTK